MPTTCIYVLTSSRSTLAGQVLIVLSHKCIYVYTVCRSSRKNIPHQSDTTHPLTTTSTSVTTSSSSLSSPVSAPSSLSSPSLLSKQLAYARTKPAHGKPFKSPPTKPRKHKAHHGSKEAPPGCLSSKSWRSVPARVVSSHDCGVKKNTRCVLKYACGTNYRIVCVVGRSGIVDFLLSVIAHL